MQFTKFSDIEQFHNLVKMVKNYPELNPGVITYKSKCKQHGTNAGVRVSGGVVTAQSRNRDLSVTDDNEGFAKWVKANEAYFINRFPIGDILIFGEWCGPGIMGGTAISKIPNKIFAVFAIITENNYEVDPDDLNMYLVGHPKDIYVIPWYTHTFKVNLSDENLQPIADELSSVVDSIESCDPWVKATFGVDGVCEGLVYYPHVDDYCTLALFDRFALKAKGEKHKVTKSKTTVQVDPEVLHSINEFVNYFVTDARVDQGVSVAGLEMKNMGTFLKWMGEDVLKESADELEASGLTWDQVKAGVQKTAREKYMTLCKRV
jgi:hypothetical protein